MAADEVYARDVVHIINEGYRAWGALKSVLSSRGLRIRPRSIYMNEYLYGAYECGMRSAERRKVNALEMKCLRSLVGVSRMDRVRNEEVRMRAEIERELVRGEDQRVLRWFGHVERLDEYRIARRVLMAEGSGGRVRGRPRLGWMDDVNVALEKEEWQWRLRDNARKIRREWRALVYLCN